MTFALDPERPLPPLGSSMIADILGVSALAGSGPWKVWSRIHGLTEDRGNRATERGNIFEAAILDYYSREKGLSVYQGTPYYERGIIGPEPWMSCHPDGFCFGRYDVNEAVAKRFPGMDQADVIDRIAPHADRLVEIKTLRYAFKSPWGEPGTDEIPPGYAAQCVWLLACMQAVNPGLDRIDLAVFSTAGDEFRIYTIRRDEEVETRLIDHCREWYARHVVEGHPPPLDDSEACSRALALGIGGNDKNRWIIPTEGDREAARRLYDLKATIKTLEAEARGIEADLKSKIGEAYGLDGIAIYYQTKRGAKSSRTFRLIYEPEESQT